MDRLGETNKKKPLYISVSVLSVMCLIGGLGNPLQKMDVYKQRSLDFLGKPSWETYIITDTDLPDSQWGFDRKKAIKVAQVKYDYKIQKVILVSLAMVLSIYSLVMSDEILRKEQTLEEVKEIKQEGQKELLIDRWKFRLAMASEEQKQRLRGELKALMGLLSETGHNSYEQELEVEDALQNKLVDVMYMTQEGHSLESSIEKCFGHKIGSEENKRMQDKYKEWEQQ